MKSLNNKNEENEVLEQDVLNEGADVLEQVDSSVPSSDKPKKKISFKRIIANVIGGDIFSKDSFVGLIPFFFYIVFLSMVYITNIYFAEDVSRDIAKLNREIEDLHVEHVYLKSEITKITKQSNMVDMLKSRGVNESVEPLKKIVVEVKGGSDEN